MNKKGLIMLYTGNGKGKTTAALGLGLRAVGHGHKVKMLQFMKGPGHVYGETIAIRRYLPGFEIEQVGLDAFVKKGSPKPEEIVAAEKGLRAAREALDGRYDLVILDEVNVAVDFGLLRLEDVIDAVRSRAPQVDVVLTGRYAPQELIDMADMVSEVREIKHHYKKGIAAQKGIEF